MTDAEVAVALRGSGGLQHRRQRLPVEGPPLTQLGGLMHPPGCLGPADPQPIRQHRGQLPAQHRSIFTGQLVDQRVLDGRQLAAEHLEALQHRQPLRSGQHIEGQIERAFHIGAQTVENLDDLLTTTRTHVRIITTGSDARQSQSQSCG